MKKRYDFNTEQEWLDYLRFYYAGMAMQGLLANSEHRKEYKGQTYLMEYNIYADQSAKLADALIEALNKTEK